MQYSIPLRQLNRQRLRRNTAILYGLYKRSSPGLLKCTT